MVGVAQLVEPLVVVQDVAGSSPVAHPTWPLVREGPLSLRYVPAHYPVRAGSVSSKHVPFSSYFSRPAGVTVRSSSQPFNVMNKCADEGATDDQVRLRLH